MADSTSPSADACAVIFNDISGSAHALSRLFYLACEGGEDAGAVCTAGANLAERIGLLAQRAAALCGDTIDFQSETQWMFSPVAVDALSVLAGKAEPE